MLGLTLGPNKARKVSRRYDDEGAGDDERVFREGAYVRCGLLALVLAVFGLGVRLRRVAGAPTTRGSRPISTAAFMQRFQLPAVSAAYGCCGVAHLLHPSDQELKASDESSNVTISGSTIGSFQGSWCFFFGIP